MHKLFPDKVYIPIVPDHWYALVGHAASSTGVSQPVFSSFETRNTLERVYDNELNEISFSELPKIELYLKNLGFTQSTTEPDLWQTTCGPIFVWTKQYDYVRVVTMRVIN